MGKRDHIGEAVSLARELATPHFWEWLFRLRQDLNREEVQLKADGDRRHNHLVECYMRARDESGKPLFRDDGKPLFHVRPGREADTVLCWREVEDGPATPVILLEHFDEMIELHEGALEHHTRNVAELESKHRRLEHIVVNHLPAHLGKVPRLDRQHTADTFADLFRELLGHLIEHASDAHDGNDMSSAQVAVTYEEAGVLNCLKKRTGRLTINVDIEQETGFSKSTVSNSVNSLIEKGLAHRPSGERKGATLTAEGQRFPTSAT